jgi:hypothetical protein
MDRKKGSDTGDMAAFGFLINALGGGGNKGSMFPEDDANDFFKGARFIPGEVTLARRAGQNVEFVSECGPNCWYWKMPDGSRIYHFDQPTYKQIGRENGREAIAGEYDTNFEDGAGPCPRCGNPHTGGGVIKESEA